MGDAVGVDEGDPVGAHVGVIDESQEPGGNVNPKPAGAGVGKLVRVSDSEPITSRQRERWRRERREVGENAVSRQG